jgi:hypothetical protein
MQAKVQSASVTTVSGPSAAEAIRVITARQVRPHIPCGYTPPNKFHVGQPLTLFLKISPLPGSHEPSAVRLHYRHVNQAERWTSIGMSKENEQYTGTISAKYMGSDYPLQYYFEFEDGKQSAWLYPGFNKTLSNQPYFVVYKRNS